MKLLLYSHYFPPSIGGVETIALSLASGLTDLRNPDGKPQFEVTVVTQTPPGEWVDAALAFRVVRRPNFRTLWKQFRIADVIHLCGPALVPLFLAWLLRKPTALEHHGYQAICPNGLLLHQPDRSMCPGHFQARNYAECLRCRASETSWLRSVIGLLLMVPRRLLTRAVARNVAITGHVLQRQSLPRSSVIYYGIEESAYKPPVSPANGRISFAYVGRFVPEKGIPILVQAAKNLAREDRSFAVQLIGDGPERHKIEDMIRKEGLERWVQITGYRTGEALAQALSSVDVVVMPSVWEETAGLSAIEHMMRGKLVIGSDVGGLREVIGDAGLRSVAGNAESLAECMRRVLQDSSLIASLGRKARDRALQLFVRERMIDQHAKMYRDLCLTATGG
jgi:glycosyltransferase involved in cell wall biosynthesis